MSRSLSFDGPCCAGTGLGNTQFKFMVHRSWNLGLLTLPASGSILSPADNPSSWLCPWVSRALPPIPPFQNNPGTWHSRASLDCGHQPCCGCQHPRPGGRVPR